MEKQHMPDVCNMKWQGLRVLVVGLGRFGGGVGVTRWLASQGAQVVVTDAAPAESLRQSIRAIADLNVPLHLGGHDVGLLDGIELAVINPAVVKHRSELFQAIAANKTPWTTEINLFCQRCPAQVIGVTGTLGKSTTAAMTAHVLQNSTNRRVYLGGNIGNSLLGELSRMGPADLVVLELSNAQLEDLDISFWRPLAVAITNLFPHHLDRHGSFEAYVRAKSNILATAGASFPIVVGPMAPEARELAGLSRNEVQCRIRPIAEAPHDASLIVPGGHNRANAACAVELAVTIGISRSDCWRALQTFHGLPDRLEFVAEIDGVRFINDSKATSPAALISSLTSIDAPLVAIVGGEATELSLADAARLLSKNCHTVVCLGASAAQFAAAIAAKANSGRLPGLRSATGMIQAVRAAVDAANAGDVVLFSPGAPSFDAYANYAERGRAFVEAVRAQQTAPAKHGQQ